MTDEERYLFDLLGYVVVREAVPAELLRQVNATIDELEQLSDDEIASRGVPRSYVQEDNKYAQKGHAANTAIGLGDYSCNILSYGGPFEEFIALPTTLPLIEEMIGEPCRLDAVAFMSRHNHGAFRFHHGYAELLPYSEFSYGEDGFKCVSVKISYALTDVGIDDGCFAVIPGSHKSAFANPLVGQVPIPDHPLVEPLPCRAGDAVVFSEDLSHGAVENHGTNTRRTLFYSYAPAFHCTWSDFVNTAPGFAARSSPARRLLVEGPPPFPEAETVNV